MNFRQMNSAIYTFMKPNAQTSRQRDHHNEERFSFWAGSNHPLIDYQYRTTLSERSLGGATSDRKQARPVFAPGFRALSNKFFRTEARQNFVLEALLFVLIVAVSAWPIASMIKALVEMLK